ncbi:toprim domain-containing protein [Acuticoccus sp. 2012]|uniref:Toprim domain-containing protein n=1 Tax=Acuticoccus mangrovi TaxID=2796142 RepID=A0A934MKY4_9HYPH|nr:toprim domain-containing protein [Acuticoccus mangrovi]MBJ3775859.1 toprim domain-containing protein [Acuticoccus mangrovi]
MIWDAAMPVAPDSLVHRYLASRSIDLGAFGATLTLRLHPGLPFYVQRDASQTDGRRFEEIHVGPAMVAAIQAPDRTLAGVHCTWLAPDGDGKAVLEDGGARLRVRKIFGAPKGGHVRFGPAGPRMAVGEGIESTLTVAAAVGVSAWAALSLANLRAPLPRVVREVVLALDNDERDHVLAERNKRVAIAAHATAGVIVRPLVPPPGNDWNDVAMDAARKSAA